MIMKSINPIHAILPSCNPVTWTFSAETLSRTRTIALVVKPLGNISQKNMNGAQG